MTHKTVTSSSVLNDLFLVVLVDKFSFSVCLSYVLTIDRWIWFDRNLVVYFRLILNDFQLKFILIFFLFNCSVIVSFYLLFLGFSLALAFSLSAVEYMGRVNWTRGIHKTNWFKMAISIHWWMEKTAKPSFSPSVEMMRTMRHIVTFRLLETFFFFHAFRVLYSASVTSSSTSVSSFFYLL